jgi:hypothetical protein
VYAEGYIVAVNSVIQLTNSQFHQHRLDLERYIGIYCWCWWYYIFWFSCTAFTLKEIYSTASLSDFDTNGVRAFMSIWFWCWTSKILQNFTRIRGGNVVFVLQRYSNINWCSSFYITNKDNNRGDFEDSG